MDLPAPPADDGIAGNELGELIPSRGRGARPDKSTPDPGLNGWMSGGVEQVDKSPAATHDSSLSQLGDKDQEASPSAAPHQWHSSIPPKGVS
jgi:hypothetical protein